MTTVDNIRKIKSSNGMCLKLSMMFMILACTILLAMGGKAKASDEKLDNGTFADNVEEPTMGTQGATYTALLSGVRITGTQKPSMDVKLTQSSDLQHEVWYLSGGQKTYTTCNVSIKWVDESGNEVTALASGIKIKAVITLVATHGERFNSYYDDQVTGYIGDAKAENLTFKRRLVENEIKNGAITKSTLTLESDFMTVGELTYSHSLTLQNNLSINYYVKAANLQSYDSVKLYVEKDSYDKNGIKTVVKTTLNGEIVDVGEGLEYKFRYAGIASYEVGNAIRAYVVAVKDGKTTTFATDTYSVKTYCYNQLAKSTASAKLKTLIVDLLNYCSLSQQQFGIRTNALVNADLTSTQKAYGSTTCKTLNNRSSETKLTGATATISGKTLVLGNNVELKIFMKMPASLDKSKVTLKITYTNMNGTSVTKNIPFSQFAYDKSSDEYSVRYADISAPEFRNVVSLSICNNGKQISNLHKYSIETYAYNRVNSSTSTELMKNLMKAMMMYSDSAVEYFK